MSGFAFITTKEKPHKGARQNNYRIYFRRLVDFSLWCILVCATLLLTTEPSYAQNKEKAGGDRQALRNKLSKHLGLKELGNNQYKIGLITFDSEKKQITIPAQVNMREGFIEYAVVHSRGKVHEAIFSTEIESRNLHIAMLLLGDKAVEKNDKIKKTPVEISIEWKDESNKLHQHSLLELIELSDPKQSQIPSEKLPKYTWRYNYNLSNCGRGSVSQFDGSFVAIIKDNTAMVNNTWIKHNQNNKPGSEVNPESKSSSRHNIHGNQKPKKEKLPSKGTKVQIKLQLYRPKK